MQGSITIAGQKILLSTIRQVYPTILAHQIVGVQPMQSPVSEIFTMRASYTPEPKYKFSRAKWYKAEFNSYDYDSVRAWCTEQFGPQPKVADAWTRWFHNYHNIIFFRDEPDYLMFLLRWGQ